MERPVEVAVFQRGELQSLRVLSPRQEKQATHYAGAVTAGVVLLAMALTAGVVSSLGWYVHAPTFFLGWAVAAGVVALLAARRARARARRYRVGVRLDADAFGIPEVDLVRRVGPGDEYDVGLVPGMKGTLDHGRSPLAIELLTRAGGVRVPLPGEGKIIVEMGQSTFVLRRRNEAPVGDVAAEGLRRGVAGARSYLPLAGAAVPVVALLSILGAIPTTRPLSDADLRSSISPNATPWEVRAHIQTRAQGQATSLHQCFDPLPLACQTPGEVWVGLALAPSGEVRGRWIVHSTYDGGSCPVTECLADVAAGWYFEPLPTSMAFILPIEVRRTQRPLYDPRPSVAYPVVMSRPYDGDGGAIEASFR